MSPLSRCWPSFAATLIAAYASLAVAAPLKRAQSQPVRKALLQGRGSAADAAQPFAAAAMDTQWFAEDAQRIAQMPPYMPDPKSKKHPACNPVCTYTCGQSECDQLCEPICLPPQCETLCTKSEDKCDTRCGKPQCAVICPLQPECATETNCPKAKCRTVCAPPVCTTSCTDSCHSVCAQPQCNWKCKPGNCPKPACKLTCPTMSCAHNFPNAKLTKVPIMPGMDIKAENRASLDPAVLMAAPTQPLPVDIKQTIPQTYRESSLGHADAPAAKTTPSPVKKLMMKWKAEDLTAQNERLLRR